MYILVSCVSAVSLLFRGGCVIFTRGEGDTCNLDRLDSLDRPALCNSEAQFRNMQIECQNYAYENGIDKPEAANWKWPY